MRANRREPVSVPFWFQSIKCRPHGGLLHNYLAICGTWRVRFGLLYYKFMQLIE